MANLYFHWDVSETFYNNASGFWEVPDVAPYGTDYNMRFLKGTPNLVDAGAGYSVGGNVLRFPGSTNAYNICEGADEFPTIVSTYLPSISMMPDCDRNYNPLTISCWFRTTSSDPGPIFGCGAITSCTGVSIPNYYQPFFYIGTDHKLYYGFQLTRVATAVRFTVPTGIVVNTGEWFYAIGRWNGWNCATFPCDIYPRYPGTWDVFLNSQKIASSTTGEVSNLTITNFSGLPWNMGGGYMHGDVLQPWPASGRSTNNRIFNGDIGDCKVWCGALSDNEIIPPKVSSIMFSCNT